MPALCMVAGSEWAAVVHVPQVKIVVPHQPGILKVLYTRVNKRNSLLSAYWLLSACFFLGFAPG